MSENEIDVEGLRREVKSLRRWKAEASSLFDGMQDLGRALGLSLGTLVTGPDAVAAAEALRGQVERVEALIEPTRVQDAISGECGEVAVHFVRARDLRAALDGPR